MRKVWVIERKLKRKGAKWTFWVLPTTGMDCEPASKKQAQKECDEFHEFDGDTAEFRVVAYGWKP